MTPSSRSTDFAGECCGSSWKARCTAFRRSSAAIPLNAVTTILLCAWANATRKRTYTTRLVSAHRRSSSLRDRITSVSRVEPTPNTAPRAAASKVPHGIHPR